MKITSWGGKCFAGAAGFLMLTGTVLRLVVGDPWGEELLHLLIPLAVAAVYWLIVRKREDTIGAFLNKHCVLWYVVTMAAAVTAMVLTRENWIKPIVVLVPLAMALLPLVKLAQDRGAWGLPVYLLGAALTVGCAFALNAFTVGVLCGVICVLLLPMACKGAGENRDRFWYTTLTLLLLAGAAGCALAYVVPDSGWYLSWMEGLRNPDYWSDGDGYWNFLARETMRIIELVGASGVTEFTYERAGSVPIGEMLDAANMRRFEILRIGYHMGWLMVGVLALAVLVLLASGVYLVIKRRRMHRAVTLTALMALGLPMFFFWPQNLGASLLTIDFCPLLNAGAARNSLWLLLVCVIAADRCGVDAQAHLQTRYKRSVRLEVPQLWYQEASFYSLPEEMEELREAFILGGVQPEKAARLFAPGGVYTVICAQGNYTGVKNLFEEYNSYGNGASVLAVLVEVRSDLASAKEMTALVEAVEEAVFTTGVETVFGMRRSGDRESRREWNVTCAIGRPAEAPKCEEGAGAVKAQEEEETQQVVPAG